MTPTCSIGEALCAPSRHYERLVRMGAKCEGPFFPLMVVSEDVLVAKYPHGAHKQRNGHIFPNRSREAYEAVQSLLDEYGDESALVEWNRSLDQLRELLTVKGFTVCEKHYGLIRPGLGAPDYETTPPYLRLSDLLRVECPECAHWHSPHIRAPACGRCGRIPPDDPVLIPHPALTEPMEWAERLGLDREKVS